jgi:hypothetical protein
MAVSVDIDKGALKYGRIVYGADCVCRCYAFTLQKQVFNPVARAINYGGRRAGRLELLRRVLGSFLKFF